LIEKWEMSSFFESWAESEQGNLFGDRVGWDKTWDIGGFLEQTGMVY
jgi:hypothetical protein